MLWFNQAWLMLKNPWIMRNETHSCFFIDLWVIWLRIIWSYHMVSLTVRIQNLFLSLLFCFVFFFFLFPFVEWLKDESMWMRQKIPTINGHVLPPFVSDLCKTKMLNCMKSSTETMCFTSISFLTYFLLEKFLSHFKNVNVKLQRN